MLKIKRIWFDDSHIWGEDTEGNVYCQSLLWYRRLSQATPAEREDFYIGLDGVHWPKLDEDISFEGFRERNGREPDDLQKYFLTRKNLNLREVSEDVGISISKLRNYIYGWLSLPEVDMSTLRHYAV